MVEDEVEFEVELFVPEAFVPVVFRFLLVVGPTNVHSLLLIAHERHGAFGTSMTHLLLRRLHKSQGRWKGNWEEEKREKRERDGRRQDGVSSISPEFVTCETEV